MEDHALNNSAEMHHATYKAAIFLADGFEEIEAVVTYDILVRAGFKVEIIGINHKINYLGLHGMVINASRTLEKIGHQIDYDVLILPGGIAVEEIETNLTLKQIFTQQINADKHIAAICAAPFTLAKWNLLKHHNAVCYPSFVESIKPLVSKFIDADVVVSGKIITSRAPSTSLLFAHTIVSEVIGNSKAREVSSDTLFDLNLNDVK